ncbi:hypothetical protein Leryth_015346 [Lithospermum erythrorhizon]|nr:hypothetical protein Leryth_015346 [Lithospermum erythrorhizon]
MEADDGENSRKVVALIEKAVDSTRPEVDPRVLKSIKYIVRNSDSELRIATRTLLSLMKRDHSQVRFLSMLIIDELFMRSKLFRTLIVENLDQLLSFSVGFKRNLPLPAPTAVASVLRSKAIEFLEKWNASFGIHYRKLRLGYEYLKNTLHYQFPNLRENAARAQQERRERELKTKEILMKKFENLTENINAIKEEIQSAVDEIAECLDIIRNKDDSMPIAPIDDEDFEEFRNSELREIRLDSLKEGERVQENSDNEIIFDALRELYKVLVTKHLTAVQEYLSVLTRVEVVNTRSRDSMLRQFIDIKNNIQSVKKRCEESGCSLRRTTSPEEDVIWEEGDLESFKKASDSKSGQDEVHASASNAHESRNEAPESSGQTSKENDKRYQADILSESDPLRSKLLAEAPLMNWGSFLDSWGSSQDILANQRGFDLDNHWGRVDLDAVIPAERIAELNVQATFYSEEPGEVQPCRAPLRNGQLCQRKDLRVCPFHGHIIPRDDDGNPIKQSSSDEELNLSVGGDLAEQLATQAVKNVRERDEKDAKQREIDRRAMKRAKLAKVREHNETVLKDAALASTSRSLYVGEETEASTQIKLSTRNKKDSLATMLKRKETAKDRLSRKLLNARQRMQV